jgi:hypothetical protein
VHIKISDSKNFLFGTVVYWMNPGLRPTLEVKRVYDNENNIQRKELYRYIRKTGKIFKNLRSRRIGFISGDYSYLGNLSDYSNTYPWDYTYNHLASKYIYQYFESYSSIDIVSSKETILYTTNGDSIIGCTMGAIILNICSYLNFISNE